VTQVFRKHVRWPALVALAALALAACGGSTSTSTTTTFKGTKKLGISTAMTGQASLYGQSVAKGLAIAVDDINAKGGVNGYKLAADILDDGTDAAKAKSLATGFSFTLKVANTPDNIQYGTLVKDQLAKAGITANVQPEEFGQILTDTEAFKFDAAVVGWSGRIDPDGNMYSWFHTGGPNNDMLYSNHDVDKWLEDARVQTDQRKRKADYQQAQKQLQQDAVYVFIFHQPATQVSSSKVRGFTLYPDGMWRLAGVWKA